MVQPAEARTALGECKFFDQTLLQRFNFCNIQGINIDDLPVLGLNGTMSARIGASLSKDRMCHSDTGSKTDELAVVRHVSDPSLNCTVAGFLYDMTYKFDHISSDFGISLVVSYGGGACLAEPTRLYKINMVYSCTLGDDEFLLPTSARMLDPCTYEVKVQTKSMCITARGYTWLGFLLTFLVGFPCLCLFISLLLHLSNKVFGRRTQFNYTKFPEVEYDNFPMEPI